MSKPVIGITPLYDKQRESIWMLPGYLKLLEKNNAIPLILPLSNEQIVLDYFIEQCDGFLFTGGQDINPHLYGDKPKSTCGELCPERDQMEVYCLKKLIDLDKPVLGICRGIQLLNVTNGGTLYQDLKTERLNSLDHQMSPPYDRTVHQVKICKDTLLANLFNKEFLGVNSYHHQAIDKLGTQIEPTAVAEDGLIEGIWMPAKKYILAVQWHPEFFAPNTPENQAIMTSFLAACK